MHLGVKGLSSRKDLSGDFGDEVEGLWLKDDGATDNSSPKG